MSAKRMIDCHQSLEGDAYELRGGRRIVIHGAAIEEVGPAPSSTSTRFVMPALVNAHDHARPVRLSSFGASGAPLELWLQFLKLVPRLDPYLAAACSLGRSALGGCGSVMVHHTRVQDPHDPIPEHAAIARAARDIGIRIGLAVAMSDRNPLLYGEHEGLLGTLNPPAREAVERRLPKSFRTPAEQLAIVDEVADACGGALVNVQYGPTGVQWCSEPLLKAIAEKSALSGRGVHMHFMESAYQRRWADEAFPSGIVPFMRDIGLLSPRLTLAHCTHARPDELEAIAESGATIVVNTNSNLALRSGVAPVRAMLAAGCRVALGLDGLTFNEDDDALSEMRLMHSLHRGQGFDNEIDERKMLAIALSTGWRSVSGELAGGVIAEGAPADLLVIDRSRLDEDAFVPDLSPVELLFARGRKTQIEELVIAGRSVMRDGVVLGIDHRSLSEELVVHIRRHADQNRDLREALGSLGTSMARHFGPAPCC